MRDNYREQNGCHNCTHCFRRYEHDDPDTYYYTEGDTEKHPLCGSVAMEEYTRDLSKTDWAKWYNWADEREVVAWKYCDSYSKK